jgi:hypothetical protein
MSTSAFPAGTVVQIDGCPHALLRKIDDIHWQVEDGRTKRILEIPEQALRELHVAGRLKLSLPPPVALGCERAPLRPVQRSEMAHGVMRELVVDNRTEFHSQSFVDACHTLGITIRYTPREASVRRRDRAIL